MATHPTARPPQRSRWSEPAAPVPTIEAPRLGYGMCLRCWLIDSVLDPQRPLCRWCDPRLANYLRQLDAAQQGETAAPALPPIELFDDPTGREWAA